MNLLVLSDLHLSPTTRDRSDQFLQFLEEARKNEDRVLIVGDLFDLWFGWRDLTMEFQKPILAKMKELFGAGLQIDYVEGNRDFGIANLQGVLFSRVASRFLDIDWFGRKIHAEHGDLVNKADFQYRIWRRISKNTFSYLLLNHLPGFLTLRLALRLEQDMRRTNQKHKTYYPEEAIKKFSLQQMQSGVDLIAVGHFHVEKAERIQSSNQFVLFYNLPGWEQGFRFLVIPSSDATPYFTNWGKENGNFATA